MKLTIDHIKLILTIILLQILFTFLVIFDVFFLRQLVGFLFLSFIPGFLILYMMRLHRMKAINVIIFSVGLSSIFLMLLGLFLNYIFRGNSEFAPFSIYNIMIFLNFSILIFLMIGLFLNRGEIKKAKSSNSSSNKFLHHIILNNIPLIFPFLSLIGVNLMNEKGNNTILLLYIIFIMIFLINVTILKNSLPKSFFQFSILMIGVSLLLMVSLTSNHLIGDDIKREYRVFQITLNEGRWYEDFSESKNKPLQNTFVYQIYYSCLSITILPTIYQLVLNVDGELIYKVFFQIIFSLVTLTLFQIYSKQTTNYVSFASIFFIILNGFFFFTMQAIIRQEFAFYFFLLIMYLLIEREMDNLKKRILLFLFSAGMIFSHYATTYISLLFIGISYTILLLSKMFINIKLNRIWSLAIILTFFSFTLAWYIYTGPNFENFADFVRRIFLSLEEFYSLEARSTPINVSFGFIESKGLLKLGLIIGTLTRIFIVIGSLVIFADIKKSKFSKEFIIFLAVGFFSIFLMVLLPSASKGYNVQRLYLQALFFLAPAYYIGIRAFTKLICSPFQKLIKNNNRKRFLVEFLTSMIFLILTLSHFAFQSGLIYEVAGEEGFTLYNREGFHYNKYFIHDTEYQSAVWLDSIHLSNWVYADRFSFFSPIVTFTEMDRRDITYLYERTSMIRRNSYIYFRYANIHGNVIINYKEDKEIDLNETLIPELISRTDKIYDNNGSEIYLLS